mmetsp:Transcript_58170/g.127633  ORF Transcript_58170/g.127633 Transcript_58170/m.127633 type:complete len:92 (+) Transcript_58170:117-392(+)
MHGEAPDGGVAVASMPVPGEKAVPGLPPPTDIWGDPAPDPLKLSSSSPAFAVVAVGDGVPVGLPGVGPADGAGGARRLQQEKPPPELTEGV